MLVVADQRAVRISRERRFAGPGEPEEQRDVAVLADIGRAVHRHHALRGQIEIERGEDRLLHLAGVGRVADQDNLLAEIDGDDGVAAHAVAFGVGLERGEIDDGEFRNKIFELGGHWANQELTNEKRVPRQLGEDPRFYPVVRIGAAIEVLGVKLLAARMGDEVVIEPLEVFRGDLAVAVPPDRIFGQCVDDRMLVLGRPAGVDAGLSAERAAFHDRGFPGRDRVLVERGRGEIPVDRAEVLEAKSIGAVGAVPQTRFLHERPPRRSRRPPDRLPVAISGRLNDSARRSIPRPIIGLARLSMLRRSSARVHCANPLSSNHFWMRSAISALFLSIIIM